MHWRIKGVVQKALSHIPLGTRVNDALQRTVGGLRRFDASVANKVEDWVDLVDRLRELGVRPAGLRLLEIGAGWFSTLPLCFRIAGAESCIMYDLHRHLSPRLTLRMVRSLEKHLRRIAEASGQPLAACEAAYAALADAGSVEDVLAAARVTYRAPADASATDLPAGNVDVIFSNSVLEHVEPEAIAALMRESRRILNPGGIAIHSANCGDHYAYFDRRITPINYLQYSKADWRFWDNRLLYQNRLRPIDFVQIAEAAGLHVLFEIHRPKPALLSRLETMPIAPDFRHYAADQLCSTSVTFAATAGGAEPVRGQV